MSNINDRIGQKNTIRVVSSVSGAAGGYAIVAENVIGGIASVSQLIVPGVISTLEEDVEFKNNILVENDARVKNNLYVDNNAFIKNTITENLVVSGISTLNIVNIDELNVEQLNSNNSNLVFVEVVDLETEQLRVIGVSIINVANIDELNANRLNAGDLIVSGISTLNIVNIDELNSNNSNLVFVNVVDLETQQLRVIGVSTFNDDIIQTSGLVGIGSTLPTQKLDILGSIKISENIYDSANSPGENSYYLSRDANGVRWISATPNFSEGIFLQDEGSLIPNVGIAQSFTVLNFTNINSLGIGTDNIIPTAADDNNPTGLATIFTKDFWGSTPDGDIYRMTNVGINTNIPVYSLDVNGDLHVTSEVQLDSSLNVSGIATINNELNVSGQVQLDSSLNVSGKTVIDNDLNVSGIATINNKLNVSGETLVNNDLNVTLDVTANKYFGIGGNLVGIVTQIVPSIGINISSTQEPGKGIVTIDAYKPTGKTIFVTQNGNDNNTGLSENHSKRTIKAAASVALFGDTIKVYPGVYVEENPIVLKKTVSVEGTELRNCVVTPKYLYQDLFYVNNGCHITDMSFIGPDMTDGAAVVSLEPLEGVEVDRYFDAARMIRFNLDYLARESVGFLTSGFSGFAGPHRDQDAARLIELNSDFIAAETIGFLTSTDYKNPAFVVVNSSGISTDPVNCEDDLKSILNAISYDLKAGSNKKAIGAGLSYYDDGGTLLHITGNDPNGYSVKEATIAAINHAVGIVTYVINNFDYASQPGITTYSLFTQDFSYSPILVSGGCTDTVDRIQNRVGIITNIIGDFNYTSGITTIFGVTLESGDCADDVKDIWKGIIHDITRGGNSKCVNSGKAYYDDEWNLIPQILKNPGEVDQTVATVDYSFNVARAIINNSTWGGYPVGLGTEVIDATYDNISGITSIIAINHGLLKDDAVKVVGLGFTCPSGPGIVTYPTGSYGYIFNVLNVIDDDTFEVVVGQSTLPHTYVSGGTVQKYTSFQDEFYQVKDLGIQKDPLVGFNNAITGCANVVSAIHSCVGIVTHIVGLGSDAFNIVGIRTSYPGNSGIGFTSLVAVQNAVYDKDSGKTILTAPGLKFIEGETIEIRDLEFSCSSNGSGISTQKFPSGFYGFDFVVDKINQDGTFEVYVGPSTLPHTYVGGGIVVDRIVAVTTAVYDNTTGITTIKALGSSFRSGDLVTIRNLEFSCPSGSGTTTIYPTGNEGFDFRVLDIVINKPFGITSAIYTNNTGIVTITAPGLELEYDNLVELRDLEFSCPDSPPNLLYPTGNNGYKFRVISSIGSTFTVNVGTSTLPHTYVSGGVAINRTKTANDEFTIQVGPSTIPHTYVSGGVVIPSFSRGVGPITQGPYVRNCTNFIGKSIGMKVDGFDAEPGDKDDIGVTGTMSVDSYTQYNQGGIGVSITNGAYAQLVSIFTICDDIGIYTESGGQCDITNSNCSFGNYGLYSKGVGDSTTKSIYRYTGIANTTANSEQSIIEVSGVGNLRPYDGQVIYFGELYYDVRSVKIINGGSGYTQPPVVTIDFPTGPNGIRAESSSTIDSSGKVVSINIISSGSQYRLGDNPKISISPPQNPGTTAIAELEFYPIYYNIQSATLPSAGISTITLNTNLNNTVGTGTTVYFSRLSLQIATSISLEWVGSGTNINTAKPALGGVTIQENEVFKDSGGQVVYTSTNQAGNFQIGDDIVINQLTGTISGRSFSQSLLNTVTPLIIALGN